MRKLSEDDIRRTSVVLENLADLVSAARLNRNMTYQDVEDATDVNAQTIYKLVKHRGDVSLGTATKLLRWLAIEGR